MRTNQYWDLILSRILCRSYQGKHCNNTKNLLFFYLLFFQNSSIKAIKKNSPVKFFHYSLLLILYVGPALLHRLYGVAASSRQGDQNDDKRKIEAENSRTEKYHPRTLLFSGPPQVRWRVASQSFDSSQTAVKPVLSARSITHGE